MSTRYTLNSHLSLFKLTGQDVASFLQNQTINVFDNKTTPQPHFTAICNPKGRIIFSLLLWQSEENYYLAVDQSLAEQFSQYVQMRIFRMAVKVSQEDTLIPTIEDNASSQVKNIKLLPADNYQRADEAVFWSVFFRSKFPWITQDSSEQFIPQHLSLDQHNLIEYQKGCYPGQEIIARLHFIGRNKKQMVVIPFNQDKYLKNGQKVTINDNQVHLCSPMIEIDGQLSAQVVKNKPLD